MPPEVVAVVLAAGRSSRTAPHHKLLATYEGVPQIVRIIRRLAASRLAGITTVIGHDADRLRPLIEVLPTRVLVNPDHDGGLAGSVKMGFAAGMPADGVMMVPADMPLLETAHIDALIAAFVPGSVVVATDQGAMRNPVILPASMAAAVDTLSGDTGARRLVRDCASVRLVELGAAASCDIDTTAAILSTGGHLPKD
ncbi:nucleotidyltransferase family protein [Aureimonas altamirensis]|uniref:nucleotidyltransferase family protein n=1 Tax=Aureimonas altamirensis TaxID=370622 RepID=UPI00301ADCD6